MTTIKIYDRDAETLMRIASEQGVTPSDLASAIFQDHFAGLENRLNAVAKDPAPATDLRMRESIAKGPLLTAKELAAHFNTTPSTIFSWYHDGTIPAEVAVGKVYRFDLERVSRALAEGASGPTIQARDLAERQSMMRMEVQALIAETDRERKNNRRRKGRDTFDPMIPTY
jgi:hypothetical protein